MVSPAPPVSHRAVHQIREPLTVTTLEVMHHLVNDDVLQAIWVLFSELDIERDASGLPVAGPPLGAHPSDIPIRYSNIEFRLPLGDQIWNLLTELLAIPVVEGLSSLLDATARRCI